MNAAQLTALRQTAEIMITSKGLHGVIPAKRAGSHQTWYQVWYLGKCVSEEHRKATADEIFSLACAGKL